MGPKNFYNAVDQRKLGTDRIDSIEGQLTSVIDELGGDTSGLIKKVNDLETSVNNIISLPDANPSDVGKTVVVDSSGQWVMRSVASLNSTELNLIETSYTEDN